MLITLKGLKFYRLIARIKRHLKPDEKEAVYMHCA